MTKFGKHISAFVVKNQQCLLGNRVGSLVGIAAGEAVNGKVSRKKFLALCEKAFDHGTEALQRMKDVS